MINLTKRLDLALRKSAWAHEQAGQHRKGTDIPYIIHPVGTMLIASNVTNDENTLIACLLHDVIEDVDASIYNQSQIEQDFGQKVLEIVKDVTKNDDITDWHKRSNAYLNHISNKACDEAVIVSASDKIHNLISVLSDYDEIGDQIWQRFSTKNAGDQVWWYDSILTAIKQRNAPEILINQLSDLINTLKAKLSS